MIVFLFLFILHFYLFLHLFLFICCLLTFTAGSAYSSPPRRAHTPFYCHLCPHTGLPACLRAFAHVRFVHYLFTVPFCVPYPTHITLRFFIPRLVPFTRFAAVRAPLVLLCCLHLAAWWFTARRVVLVCFARAFLPAIAVHPGYHHRTPQLTDSPSVPEFVAAFGLFSQFLDACCTLPFPVDYGQTVCACRPVLLFAF